MLSLLFAAAYFTVFYVQLFALGGFDFLPSASILFLPAGVKLLAMLSGRWHGILGLYLGKLAVDLLLLGNLFTFEMVVVHPLLWIGPAYLALRMVMWRHNIQDGLNNLTTYHIVLIALATSLASALATQTNLVYFDQAHSHWLRGVWSMTIGDVSGIVLTLMVITFVRRWKIERTNWQ